MSFAFTKLEFFTVFLRFDDMDQALRNAFTNVHLTFQDEVMLGEVFWVFD